MSVSWLQENCQTLSYQDHTLNNSRAEKYEKKNSEINQVLLYCTKKEGRFGVIETQFDTIFKFKGSSR